MFGSDIGALAVKVTADTSALSKQISEDATKAGTSAGSSFGKKFVTGLAAVGAGAAVLGFTKSVVTEASDLNESLNAVNVTFGKSAAGITKLGQEAAYAVGLSNNEFNSLAVRFSSFANTIAKAGGGTVVGTIDDMTKRAADFASVMNLDVNEAAQIFQSGLAGETEPLKRFGIDLSAARVEAYAMSKGIATSAASMTEAQKVQARYELLMKSTAKTQGDFQNTSGGLANASRILGAAWKDIQAQLGAGLLPVLSSFVSLIAQKALPALKGLFDLVVRGDFTGALGQAFGLAEDSPIIPRLLEIRQTVIDVFTTIFGYAKQLGAGLFSGIIDSVKFLYQWRDVLLPIAAAIVAIVAAIKIWNAIMLVQQAIIKAVTAVQIALNVVLSANPIGLIVLAIVGLVAALVVLYNRSETVRNIIDAAWQGIKTAVVAVINFLKPIMLALWDGFTDALRTILPTVIAVWNVIKTIIGVAVKVIGTILSVWIKAAIIYFKVGWKIISTIVKVAWAVIKTVIFPTVKAIIKVIQVAWKVVSVAFKVYWTLISTIIKAAWTVIKAIVQAGITFVMDQWHRLQAIIAIIRTIFSTVVNTIRDKISAAVDTVRTIKDRIVGFFDGAIDWLYEAGKNIIQGLIDGIGDMLGPVGDAIGAVAGKVKDYWPFSPAKEGPLSSHGGYAMRFAGGRIGEQLADGIRGSKSLVAGAAGDLVAPVRDAAALRVSPTFQGADGLTVGSDWPAPEVRVFIGDRELTDIVRVETSRQGALAGRAYQHRRN